METIKYGVIGLVVLAVLLGLWGVSAYVGTNNQAAVYEAEIPAQMALCATKIDAGYQTIQLQYQISQDQAGTIKDYLRLMFQSATDPNGQETFATSQTNLVGAIMQYSVLGNTDLNELALNVQDTVSTIFSEYVSCIQRAGALKAEYQKMLHQFPSNVFIDQLNLPYTLSDGANMPRTDIDGDGRITVLDYKTVIVSSLTAGSFDTGQLPQLTLPTQAP
jgi:hypothetical protein